MGRKRGEQSERQAGTGTFRRGQIGMERGTHSVGTDMEKGVQRWDERLSKCKRKQLPDRPTPQTGKQGPERVSTCPKPHRK